MKAIITGTPLPDRYVQALESLGVSSVNGSRSVLLGLGVGTEDADRELSEEEVARVIVDADIYIYGGLEPATAHVLGSAGQLKLISFLGTGWADPGCVDASAAAAQHLKVTNTAHANAASVAEAAIGLMVSLERGFFSMNRATKEGSWAPVRRRDLAGKKLGIIGLGAIGGRLANLAVRGFGMKVYYVGPHRKPDAENELGVQRSDLKSVFAECDFVSVHAPADANGGMIDAHSLGLARKDLALINLSAPEIVEPHALIDALSDGTIRAAMDGMYKDETIRRRLLQMDDDRFVVLPRAAWLTDDSYNRMGDMALESIQDFVAGREIRHRVL